MDVLGKTIKKGQSAEVNLEVAQLHTGTPVNVPVIISRSKEDGPTLLIIAGVHGDEINGIEIVRRIVHEKINKPKCGTIICLPILNVFGFLNKSRELPDGRDLNRSFPGSKSGSLAGQVANAFVKNILPLADVIIDFHTGADQRSNYSQIRCAPNNPQAIELAKIFNAPFLKYSKLISRSLRETITKSGKDVILFEGGKSNYINEKVVTEGIEGVKRVINHLKMNDFETSVNNTKEINDSKWIRAGKSGMFKSLIPNGSKVLKGEAIGKINEPYGKFERTVHAPNDGYIFCINESPIVNKGDAIFHIGYK